MKSATMPIVIQSPAIPRCRPELLPTLPHGSADCDDDVEIGAACHFSCDAGFVKITPGKGEFMAINHAADVTCVTDGSDGAEWRRNSASAIACVDVDECALVDVCNAEGGSGFLCRNLPGSYECVCPRGHFEAKERRCLPLWSVRVKHPLAALLNETSTTTTATTAAESDDERLRLMRLWATTLNITVDDVDIVIDDDADNEETDVAESEDERMIRYEIRLKIDSRSTKAESLVQLLKAAKAFDLVYVDDKDECSVDDDNDRLCKDRNARMQECKNVPWSFECGSSTTTTTTTTRIESLLPFPLPASLSSLRILVLVLVAALMVALLTSLLLCFVLCYSRRRRSSIYFRRQTFTNSSLVEKGGGGGGRFTAKDNMAFEPDELDLTDMTATSSFVEDKSFNERYIH